MAKKQFPASDLIQARLEKLAELFPGAVTERCGKSGRLEKTVNFAILRQLLGACDYPGPEHYEFTWVGKRQAIREAASPCLAALRPCPGESKNWENTRNLYIEGDNLDALKLLRQSHLEKISLIYIDPPYNTGNDFIFQDNFCIAKKDWRGDKSKAENPAEADLLKNREASGRVHSAWCCMICPRLILARDLLSPVGVIFISCDDNEQASLKEICDEIFGGENFITCLAVENNPKGRKNSAFVAQSHEYCLAYGKNLRAIHENLRKNKQKKFFRPLERNNDRRPLREDERGVFRQSKRQVCGANKSSPLAAQSRPERCFAIYHCPAENKIELLDEYDPARDEYVISPDGLKLLKKGYARYIASNSISGRPAIPLYTKRGILRLFENGALHFKKNGIIYEKDRARGVQINSLLNNKKHGLDLLTESATTQLAALFGRKEIFKNSKSVDFIKSLLYLYPAKDFICLDFFSGSASAAHAMLQLNAEDGGSRRFIMVQAPVACPPDSPAARAGYVNICEIGKERIRRAGEKISKAFAGKAGIENLDCGFRVLKCVPRSRNGGGMPPYSGHPEE